MSELYAPLSGRRLKVTSVVRETEDAVSVVLGGQHAAPIAFAPGQFFTVIINKQGTVLRRAYSASSAPGDHHGGVRLTVKRVPGGRVSNDIVDNTVAGEEWTVLGPSGSFSPAPSTSSRHLVLIAGGSGITPMMSIARTLLSTEPMTRLSLIYGNRAYRDIIFHDELRALANSNVGRLTVRLVLEEATAEWVDGKGRLDATVLQNELGAVGAADTYFVCGPGPMVEAARDALRTLGVADAQIRAEAFTQPELRREAQLPSESQRVRLRSKQGETQFTQAPKQTLLEAATRANVAIPFSCTIGACGSCKARVVDGEVRMQEPNCLSQEEKVQGFVLTCVGNATSPTTLELE
jgi:ferredoxin-NADP reductase